VAGSVHPDTDVYYLGITDGSGGTFTINYNLTNPRLTTPTTTTSALYATFEANTVLYKVDGGKWTAMKPTTGNFGADIDDSKPINSSRGTYTFLKSDPDKGYDIIIKTN
jgi:hypothetical protein